jgi:hypothetical protein
MYEQHPIIMGVFDKGEFVGSETVVSVGLLPTYNSKTRTFTDIKFAKLGLLPTYNSKTRTFTDIKFTVRPDSVPRIQWG